MSSAITRAMLFAQEHHGGQVRHSGEPYIIHPVGCARIVVDVGMDDVSVIAALLHDTVEDTGATLADIEREFGAEVATIVDGVHQAVEDPLRLQGRAPGRELPQADRLDVGRHPGADRQAGRPAAQHAHAGVHDQAKADPEGARDARGLRTARASPRYPVAEVGAGGSGLRGAAPAPVLRDPADGQPAAGRPRIVCRRGRRVPVGRTAHGRHHRRDHRAGEALLLDLREDDPQGQGIQRDLRPHRDAGARGVRARLLRRGRDHPFAVEADARPLQGLHRGPEAEHVPVAAHDRRRARGPAAGDPDPHPRHAPHGRVRRRRPLALQGRPPGLRAATTRGSTG